MKRIELLVTGKVQGVGFRPKVYSLAKEMNLTGWIRNDGGGVVIEAQGEYVDRLQEKIISNLPPLAKISDIKQRVLLASDNEKKFQIIKSQKNSLLDDVVADAHTCNDCLTELFTPDNRFYHYPFISCTQCGPRYSIIKKLPYDRKNTTMNIFPMCRLCQESYNSPLNRRHHAQPIACHDCGPAYSHSIRFMVDKLKDGKILAVKSLGGFQFICLAKNTSAVLRLREKKYRKDKPFAMMALNERSIKNKVSIDSLEKKLLYSHQRPILLLEKKHRDIDDLISPGLSTLGIMLPYTPLHYLLLHGLIGKPQGNDWLLEKEAPLLVVTSANAPGQAIITDNQQAIADLSSIADYVITHNREIASFVDDSVLRVIGKRCIPIRMSRGYSPNSIKLSKKLPESLAVGGDFKNSFCLVRDNNAYISQHIGNLSSVKNLKVLNTQIEHIKKLLEISPVCVGHDKHPDFETTAFAHSLEIKSYAVQHHHAHLAAVAAEKHIDKAIGLALDGFGYGDNGKIWGGELCLLNQDNMRYLGQLAPVAMPGGDIAAKQGWRMAIAVLDKLAMSDIMEKQYAKYPVAAILEMVTKSINTPSTSSCGRLFDIASSLLNVCHESNYEGQAAMQLESLVKTPKIYKNGWVINNNTINFLPLLKKIVTEDAKSGAEYFHGTIAAGLSQWIKNIAEELNVDTIILSGGCFINKVLSENLLENLADYNVNMPEKSSINDGGLSLGQAYIAGLKHKNQTIRV